MIERRALLFGMVGMIAAGAMPARIRAADVADIDWEAAKWYGRSRQFADTQFGRIAYVKHGSGPVALFLHGFPLSSFQWRGAIERLAGTRTCLAPDFLALGHTEVAAGQDVGPASQVEMIIELLDKLEINSVDLVANDSGGAVAQLLLVRRPDLVRSMLLTNCDVEVDSPPPALLPVIELAEKGTYPDDWLVPWLADKTLARSDKGIGGMCYTDPRNPTDAAIEMYFGPILRSSEAKRLINSYTIGLKPNSLDGIAGRLRQCRLPTAIVWGMADPIFSNQSPEYLKSVLPNVTAIRRLKEAKLFFPEEYPDVIAEEARRLWSL